MLRSTERLDVAVGYLFASGIVPVVQDLAALKQIRVLVGRADGRVLENIARGLQERTAIRAALDQGALVRRSERETLAHDNVRLIAEGISRAPQSTEQEEAMKTLRSLIAQDALTIRAYTRSPLHAKAYLCWYEGHAERGSAIVGSSNFSLAGFEGNTELNVRVTGDLEMAQLEAWFEALWADSVDVTSAAASAIDESWPLAQPTPYEMYLKALFELHLDDLGNPDLTPRSGHVPELPNFQLDAVRRALLMVERHGGCVIGDVVGLGKTYIAGELVRQLQYWEPRGRHPLIICPASLRPMWERTNELFGLGAKVVSMSAITPSSEPLDEAELQPAEKAAGLDLVAEYPDRGVVVVDESHNFRNPATRRYRALSQYLATGEHRVVLISATPQNLGPADIYHQLRLFVSELDHGLPIEPVGLEDFFRAVQAWYRYRADSENWAEAHRQWETSSPAEREQVSEPAAPSRPSAPFATIDQVLNPVFIRRRRRDIRELYGDDVEIGGRRVVFPEAALENLSYRLDRVYARAGPFETLQELIQRHRGARYLPVDYLRPDRQGLDRYRDVLRARNRVARLTAHLLWKRLESSVAAFRSTLETLHASNAHFSQSLGAGVVPMGRVATRMLAGEMFSVDDLLSRSEDEGAQTGRGQSLELFPAQDFDVAAWQRDLAADRELLAELLQRTGRIPPDDDDKLHSLRTLLGEPSVRAGKVLLFSEAAATIDYLYEHLRHGEPEGEVERLTGGDASRAASVVKRFAPKANLAPGESLQGAEVRVLLATDVVSEGQNLQDCNRVINYDLHWNPVRLIQRFGRVDRIGTEHQRIFLHNTWPDLAVDTELSLTERLRNRIQAFHDLIGLDTQLLDPAERVNAAAMYRIYESRELPESDDQADEVAVYQRGIALLQSIREDDPALWERLVALPDGLRSAKGRRHRGEHETPVPSSDALSLSGHLAGDPRETVVLFKQGSHPLAYAVGSDLDPRRITTAQLVEELACEPDEPRVELPPDTNARVSAAREAAQAEVSSKLGHARQPTSNSRPRRYIARGLAAVRDQTTDPAALARIGALQAIFSDQHPPAVVGELEEIRRLGLAGDRLVVRLEAIRDRYRLHRINPVESEAGPDVLRTITSVGLHGEQT